MSLLVPVCVECLVEMRCAKNEQAVMMDGTSIYSGDRYKCPGCGNGVIVGFSSRPVATRYDGAPGQFEKALDQLKPLEARTNV